MIRNKYRGLIKPIEYELKRRIEVWGGASASNIEREKMTNRYFRLEQALRLIMCKPLTIKDIKLADMKDELVRFGEQIKVGMQLHTDKREHFTQKEVLKLLNEYIKIEMDTNKSAK